MLLAQRDKPRKSRCAWGDPPGDLTPGPGSSAGLEGLTKFQSPLNDDAGNFGPCTCLYRQRMPLFGWTHSQTSSWCQFSGINKFKAGILNMRNGIFNSARRTQVGALLLLLAVSRWPPACSQGCLASLKYCSTLLEELAHATLGTCPQPGHDGGDVWLNMAEGP